MSTAISIEGLCKEYRLGVIGHGTLYRDLQSWWARLRDREDPNSLIGNDPNAAGDERILALNHVDLEVEEGEVLGIIGRNGAGKSTLLKILSRVTAPSSGSVRIRGRVASLLEVGTGFHPELTGRENIYLNAAINGMDRGEVRGKLDAIVEFAGVEQFLDTPVKRYSSGMYVRLGFAVAAHLDPDILVVDEVLAVGDYDFQRKCVGKMKDVSEGEGRTVLFVSHNLASVRDLCSRAILLEGGEKVMEGDTEETISRYVDSATVRGSVWSADDAGDSETCVEVSKVLLLNDSGESDEVFTVRDNIHLQIEYRLQASVEGLHVGFFLKNERDLTILFAFDSQHDPDLMGSRPPGKYTSTCRIPADFLNDGSYSVIVKIHDKDSTYFEHDAVSFDVQDSRDPEGVRGLWSLGSEGRWPRTMVRPRLDWRVDRPGD